MPRYSKNVEVAFDPNRRTHILTHECAYLSCVLARSFHIFLTFALVQVRMERQQRRCQSSSSWRNSSTAACEATLEMTMLPTYMRKSTTGAQKSAARRRRRPATPAPVWPTHIYKFMTVYAINFITHTRCRGRRVNKFSAAGYVFYSRALQI